MGPGEQRVKGDELVSLVIVASIASGEYLTAAVVSFVMVTGEPVPRDKRAGDPVYAGALNQNGVVVVLAPGSAGRRSPDSHVRQRPAQVLDQVLRRLHSDGEANHGIGDPPP